MVLGLAATVGNGGVQERLVEGLWMALVGMLVVFTALSLTAVVILLLNRLDARQKARAPAHAPAAPPATKRADDPQLIAVLTAAAVAALGQHARVRSATPAN